MRIQKSYVAGGYRLIIGLMALDALSAQFAVLGQNAWRLFDTWTILLSAVYFCLMAVMTFGGWRQSNRGRMLCPMLYGMIITGNIGAMALWIVFHANGLPWLGGAYGGVFVLDFLVPILTVFDWLIFSRKGDFRVYYPLYWLTLPLIFMAGMIVTSQWLPASNPLRFPYEFLNYHVVGIDQMVWWGVIISVLMLALGYGIMVLDFAMSGRLGKYIVLPKIKTIIIEEEPEEPKKPAPKPVEKTVKKDTKPKQAKKTTKTAKK